MTRSTFGGVRDSHHALAVLTASGAFGPGGDRPLRFRLCVLMGRDCFTRRERTRWHFWPLCADVRWASRYPVLRSRQTCMDSRAQGGEDSGMAFRRPRPGRDIRIASREDPLRLFLGNYQLTACCRRPGCAHRRDLHAELLIRAFGADTTLGSIGARLRCIAAGCEVPGSRRGTLGRREMGDERRVSEHTSITNDRFPDASPPRTQRVWMPRPLQAWHDVARALSMLRFSRAQFRTCSSIRLCHW